MFGNSNAGAVYISEIGADDALPSSDDLKITAIQLQDWFKKFILNFKLNGQTVYREQIRSIHANLGESSTDETSGAVKNAEIASVRLDLEHLAKWRVADYGSTEHHDDTASQTSQEVDRTQRGEVMMHSFRRNPLKYIPAAENALKEIFMTFDDEARIGGNHSLSHFSCSSSPTEHELAHVPYIQLELLSRDRPIKIRDLKAGEVESLVVIPGIVLQAAKPLHKGTLLKLRCKDCKIEKLMRIPPWRQAVMLPRTCDAPRRPDEPRCGLDSYSILSDESMYIDVQNIKLQELSEDVPTGDMPRHIVLNCAGSLCGRLVPGERVVVVGAFSSFDRDGRDGPRSPYIHCLGIDYYDTSGQRREQVWTYRDEEDFRKMAQDPDITKKIVDSIAPAIFGNEDIKKTIACLLFSGSRKRLPDGTRVRGDINVLLLGDPSTAKSQFLKFASKCAPVAVYTSGKGSSAAGLTAAIVRDSAGNFALEGGAMVLADGGVVCIDEFDKMRDNDRVGIHETMEQQTISIAKAGITTVLNTKCAVLAAANPSFGSYDDSKDTTEQHDFETTILSRFDLIWVIRDERNIEKDRTIAKHIFLLHAGCADDFVRQGAIQPERLRQYISYCKSVCDPRISESAAKKLENYYVDVRNACRTDLRRKRDQIPITVRQLESLARIAESLAKMTLSQEANETHVAEAIRLFNLATVEASKSSMSKDALSTVDRSLIKAAEAAILLRLPVNARASKATVVRDLRLRGYEAVHITMALSILIQRGALEERGDASVRRIPTSD